ncbi:MAG: HAD family phosphatase [Clostridia bacterium]|nr:HAD family phosphatase [Clostridia bacterium]
MGKFNGILICTDLDGTLYRNDKSISRENKEAVEYFKSEGGSFTFITGRMPYYSTDAYRAARPNVPFGCVNGGGVYDGEAGKYIFKLPLSTLVYDLVRHIDKSFLDVGIQLCSFDRTYFAKENGVTVRFREITGVPPLFCNYEDFSEPIGKVIFCTDKEEEIKAVESALGSHPLASEFDFIRSERTLFEILPKGVNKGLALGKLAEYLNISIENTIAVGDYDNDAAMLRAAGRGIAVANASRAALEAADIVTVSNEEHAIARIIYDLESGKI